MPESFPDTEGWQTPAARKRPDPVPSTWDTETRANIAWFKKLKPPAESFALREGCTIVSPKQFFERLLDDIKGGPATPRARMGALQTDLRDLRRIFDARH